VQEAGWGQENKKLQQLWPQNYVGLQKNSGTDLPPFTHPRLYSFFVLKNVIYSIYKPHLSTRAFRSAPRASLKLYPTSSVLM
jgi:hypothetical protein